MEFYGVGVWVSIVVKSGRFVIDGGFCSVEKKYFGSGERLGFGGILNEIFIF